MQLDKDHCRGYGDWRTKGWWRAERGAEVHVLNTTNRYAGFYVEGDDGAHWSGIYGPVYVYADAFDSCINIGSSAAYGTVGMQLVDLGSNAWMPWADAHRAPQPVGTGARRFRVATRPPTLDPWLSSPPR